MKRICCCVLGMLAVTVAQNASQVNLNNDQEEVVAAPNPVDKPSVDVISDKCSENKKALKLSYEDMKGKEEPDVKNMTIVYRTKSTTKVYNISSAAKLLREEHDGDCLEKVIVYAHGFVDNPYKGGALEITNNFLNSHEARRVTLLALDASWLLQSQYIRATTYVIFIGRKLAEMLLAMMESGLKLSNIHLVGHSLGAHICGFAGKAIFAQTGEKLARITGLDPARPCFADVSPISGLYYTDAEYVDVIHTDAGGYGIKSPLGHADFFPNKGERQPNCSAVGCSHGRSPSLFAESLVRRHAFPARRCDSWQAFTEGRCSREISYMGYASRPGSRGLYYLQTAGSRPYGLRRKGIKYTNNTDTLNNTEKV